MSAWRLWSLILGPLLIVVGSYRLTMTAAVERPAISTGPIVPDSAAPVDRAIELAGAPLRQACERKAADLRQRVAASCRFVVRPPYVIGGDLTAEELERHYQDTLRPTARALAIAFFDRAPDAPVSVLLFSNRESYLDHARRLDGRNVSPYYGYYEWGDRRIMVNAATGDGTLAHELTHALAHFDFPAMPEWFDEGLASLYEEARFSADGRELIGVSNWRLNFLMDATRRNRLGQLASLIASYGVRLDHQAVEYAHARYFCLYLQEQRLLQAYYRKFRVNAERDPTGAETLRELLETQSLDELDRDFRRWLVELARRS